MEIGNIITRILVFLPIVIGIIGTIVYVKVSKSVKVWHIIVLCIYFIVMIYKVINVWNTY